MPVHAIEVTLIRPALKRELRAARHKCAIPLAVSADRTRLLTVISTANRQVALSGVWAALGDLLPIDTLSTAYPGKDGMHLLSVQVSDEVYARVRYAAAASGQDPDEYATRALRDGMSRDRADEAARLNTLLDRLVAEFGPEQTTAAAARRIALQSEAVTASG